MSADGYITTGQGILSYNMYAYCLNNPVIYIDPTGTCIVNARGDVFHHNCKYDPRKQFSVLNSASKNTLEYNIIEKETYGYKISTGVSLSESKGNKKNTLITVETNTCKSSIKILGEMANEKNST